MEKAICVALLIFSLFLLCAPAWSESAYDLKVKKLYAEPTATSNVVYEIPLEVKLLDISEDYDWYKVFLKFNIGPMSFNYTGWANIPIGNIIAEKEKAKLATSK